MSELWTTILQRLEDELPEQQVNTWLRPLQALEEGSTLRLYAPNRFAVDWVQANAADRIRVLLGELRGADARLSVEIGSMVPVKAPPAAPEPPRNGARRATPESTIQIGTRLNPESTFELFVEGKSNHFAKAAALQVAENPGTAYNPLFIYGGTGLGKTHLMQAVGHVIKQRDPDARVAYVHSERFVDNMVQALRHNTMNEFKTAYRGLSALLIDDIQFFANKDRSQEEFFHTFNALFEGQAQIIMTSDRYPKEIPGPGRAAEIALRLGIVGGHRAAGTRDLRGHPDQQGAGRRRDSAGRSSVFRGQAHPLECARARRRAAPDHRQCALHRAADHAGFREGSAEGSAEPAGATGDHREHPEDRGRLFQGARCRICCRSDAAVRWRGRGRSRWRWRRSSPRTACRRSASAFGGRDHTTVLHACKRIKELQESEPRVAEDYSNLLRTLTG